MNGQDKEATKSNAILKEDARSYGKGLQLYAPKGKKIEIITTSHDPVYICRYNNNTFPVHKYKLII